MVREGACWITLADGSSHPLLAGESITVPRGGVIQYGSTPGTSTLSLTEIWDEPTFRDLSESPAAFYQKTSGGGGQHCRIFGLAFELSGQPLLSDLPEVIFSKSNAEIMYLGGAFNDYLTGSPELGPGGFAQRMRFAEGILISQLRKYILTAEHTNGWVAGLKDPRLNRALRVIHKRFDEPWSVQRLAAECGMSRSAFAHYFKSVMRCAPLRYLNDWRTYQACQRLSGGRDSITTIAEAVGFRSDHVLRRNVRRITGKTPRELRAQQQTSTNP